MAERGQFDDLFHEANPLQLCLRRSQAIQRDVFKDLGHHVASTQISNALKCLDLEGHVLSLSDKVDKTVNQLARETSKASRHKENYLVENSLEQTMPFHPSISGQLNARTIRNPP